MQVSAFLYITPFKQVSIAFRGSFSIIEIISCNPIETLSEPANSFLIFDATCILKCPKNIEEPYITTVSANGQDSDDEHEAALECHPHLLCLENSACLGFTLHNRGLFGEGLQLLKALRLIAVSLGAGRETYDYSNYKL